MKRETRQLQKSTTALSYRRINWRIETRHRVRQAFERLALLASSNKYPFQLYVQEFEQPNEGTIQVSAGANPTGAVNRKTEFDWASGLTHNDDSAVMESGGALVASQSVSGHIHFIVYPYSSDRVQPNRKEIMLLRPLDPREVTPALIDTVVRRYLLCIRGSSTYGRSDGLTLWDRLLLLWIRSQDIRFKHRIAKSFLSLQNEWGKALVAGLVALIVGYLAGGKT